MRKRKEDGESREKNLEEQLAVETSANQDLQVRFFVGRMRKLLWQTAYLNLICYDSILLLSHHWRVQRVQVDWSRNLVTREPILKPVAECALKFSRAWSGVLVFSLNSHWLLLLSTLFWLVVAIIFVPRHLVTRRSVMLQLLFLLNVKGTIGWTCGP